MRIWAIRSLTDRWVSRVCSKVPEEKRFAPARSYIVFVADKAYAECRMPSLNTPLDAQLLYSSIRQSSAKLVSADGSAQSLPQSLPEFLTKLTDGLREGQSIAIVQDDAQLTTVEGARMLGISRQFLIKLLERREIPYYMVGAHRRVYVRDLLAYKAKRDANRRQILDELSRAEGAEGLYDLDPPDAR